MTTTQNRKTSNGAKSSAKTAPRSANRQPSRNARSRRPEVPGWAATIASVVGVGVAVGVGLYATRRQWLPTAESWGEDLNDRFTDLREKYSGQASNDHQDAQDDWDDEVGLSEAAYPAARPAA